LLITPQPAAGRVHDSGAAIENLSMKLGLPDEAMGGLLWREALTRYIF
jgi:hypothetical protein